MGGWLARGVWRLGVAGLVSAYVLHETYLSSMCVCLGRHTRCCLPEPPMASLLRLLYFPFVVPPRRVLRVAGIGICMVYALRLPRVGAHGCLASL